MFNTDNFTVLAFCEALHREDRAQLRVEAARPVRRRSEAWRRIAQEEVDAANHKAGREAARPKRRPGTRAKRVAAPA